MLKLFFFQLAAQHIMLSPIDGESKDLRKVWSILQATQETQRGFPKRQQYSLSLN